jgi:hypothetical protein
MISPMSMSEMIGRKVLVSTDNYFIAPDGRQYRAVFGKLAGVQTAEESLGVKVNVRSQDWYLTVGNMRIAGCQIHYAILTDECIGGRAVDYTTGSEGCKEFLRPSLIYFADDDSQSGS